MSCSPRRSVGRQVRGFALNIALLFTLVALGQIIGEGMVRTARAATPPLDVPYVPTPDDVVHRMLEMAETQPGDYVIDLGSGDGRIVVAALRDWNVRAALGVDLNPQRIAEARENARKAGVFDRATFVQGDLFEMDFSEASVLTMYLLPAVNLRLRPVILEKMRPGTRVVSHAFTMGDWEPDQRDAVEGSNIFLWVVPAQVAGRWSLVSKDGKAVSLLLNQSYQQISGSAMADTNTTPLTETLLRGADISFSIGSDRYEGTVRGNRIVPRDGSADWHVRRR
jgi:SAM-dependent methyltransferase